MWKTIGAGLLTKINPNTFLSANELLHQQLRTTFILKRRFPPQLHKKGSKPKTLRSKHYVYDLVKDTTVEKQPNIEVILTSYIKGLGQVGDKVSVRSNYAYDNLLLPGLAVYANPENIEKYKDLNQEKEQLQYSSTNVLYTVGGLSRLMLSIVMNAENSWTLKPWHVKTSFRKCGFVVPEETITMPEQPITGPDMNLENKEFVITVTINNMEKVNVRCRIHHWSTNIGDRLPYEFKFWEKPSDPLLPEQASLLETLWKNQQEPSEKDVNK